MHPFWIVDKPDIFVQPEDPSRFEIKLWIATLEKIDKLEFADSAVASVLPLSFEKRQDIESSYPHLVVSGFRGECAFEHVKDREWLGLVLETGGSSYEIVIPVHGMKTDAAALKAVKMKKLFSRLRCPHCHKAKMIILRDSFSEVIDRMKRPGESGHKPGLGARALLALIRIRLTAAFLRFVRRLVIRWKNVVFTEKDYLVCLHCCAAFPVDDNHYDFLPDVLARKCGIKQGCSVSSNQYDGLAWNYVYKHRNGLILDCGSGCRSKCCENVVNFEIVPYESTDVLGVAERLPFKDNTFDAIFSFSVLEHVKDPFAVAREMIRVLKPGGGIYCQAAFLSPLHGYPDHYFNMTRQGLNHLFEGLVDIERLDTHNFGQPVFALSWFLRFYVVGLPPELQESFKAMKVGDLIKPGPDYMGMPFVRHLSDEVQNILACNNYMVATKKQGVSS